MSNSPVISFEHKRFQWLNSHHKILIAHDIVSDISVFTIGLDLDPISFDEVVDLLADEFNWTTEQAAARVFWMKTGFECGEPIPDFFMRKKSIAIHPSLYDPNCQSRFAENVKTLQDAIKNNMFEGKVKFQGLPGCDNLVFYCARQDDHTLATLMVVI